MRAFTLSAHAFSHSRMAAGYFSPHSFRNSANRSTAAASVGAV
jgi:hypothetical protein